MTCSKPFRLLQLPSFVHNVIFSMMDHEDVYHLSKCSTKILYAVKMFTRRQTYCFKTLARNSYYCLRIWSDDGPKTFYHELRPMDYRETVDDHRLVTYCEDYWATTKEEVLYLDVLTREVNVLELYDATKATEFLKTVTSSPIRSGLYCNDKMIIDDEVYKYVLKEFKNAKELIIRGSPSTEFRFDKMEPFTGEYISIEPADWVTVDHLVRCFSNVPIRLFWIMEPPKPFRLLQLPSLARDVIFSLMHIGDVYHLSKCSTRSRYAVKMFTRRQSYYFGITADKSCYILKFLCDDERGGKKTLFELRFRDAVDDPMLMQNRKDNWESTQKEVLYFLDVFTRQVSHCHFYDATKVIETTEFVKRVTPYPVEWIFYCNDKTIIDDEVYKYILKEFKNAKRLNISASPSAEFRFDEVEPFTGEYIFITNADWVTVDHLVRCFSNVIRLSLLSVDTEKCLLTPQVMPQFFNAWRNGSGIRDLELECYWRNSEFQAMFENVPKKVVKRVEVESIKQVFKEGRCFLIRQEESGVEAVAYRYYEMFYFTTNFRLLRDDESAVGSFDSENDEEEDDEEGDSESDEDI